MRPSRFGARLRELRQAAGLTQLALARKAGLSHHAICHWEQGLREPSWSSVLALAQALRVDIRVFQQRPRQIPVCSRGRPPKIQKKPVSGSRKK